MALTPLEVKMLKYLQNNPAFLDKVQDPNAFVEAIAETRVDRNHRFILGALDARERTNWTNDERDAQDAFISELGDALDAVVSMMSERFKVKSNDKETWHALSFQTEDGQTLNLKLSTSFGHTPNKVWVETEVEEKVESAPAPKPAKK